MVVLRAIESSFDNLNTNCKYPSQNRLRTNFIVQSASGTFRAIRIHRQGYDAVATRPISQVFFVGTSGD